VTSPRNNRSKDETTSNNDAGDVSITPAKLFALFGVISHSAFASITPAIALTP
jgi:hypothetical protein